jgi:M6 family metalloprotease-like protein
LIAHRDMGVFSTRSNFYIFLLFFGLFQIVVSSGSVFSVGAYPFPQEVTQPDGTVLTIRQHGDEWYNWTTTTDGYRILKSQKGYFEYAAQLKSGKIITSGVRASDPKDRNITEKTFLSSTTQNIGISRKDVLEKRKNKSQGTLKSSMMSTSFPSSGTPNLLLLLVNFSDTSPTYSYSVFDDFMNLPDYNGTGSFKDYYEEVSDGQLSIQTSVSDWINIPGTHDYYGPETKWKEFALHAVQAASNAGIDFSKFDNDGDGVVEGVAIIHQGTGEEITGNENDIWSHSYSFSSAGISTSERTFNGVIVDQYTIHPELHNVSGDINTIGVICHEFGHNLGLPDFYDINEDTNGQYDGTGRWDIMAGGTYNGSPAGAFPAHHNPFSKEELGWVNVTVIDNPGTITLEPVISSTQILRVNSPVNNEYLLIENRQKTGFDSHIYSAGMLVYHADENLINERRSSNTINIDEHQGFYPIAANHIINSESCPFPGTGNITELTDTSDPAMTTWDGTGFNRSITQITHSNGTISFDFMSIQDGSPISFQATANDEKSISLNWTPGSINSSELPVLLAWNTTPTFGTPIDGTIYNSGDPIDGGGTVLFYGNAAQEFIHDNLNSSTQYYYKIWSDKGNSYSQNLSSTTTTRPTPISTFPWTDSFETGLVNWIQKFIIGSVAWTKDPLEIGESFTPAYSGNLYASFAQLKWTAKTTQLISPVFNFESGQNYALKFRHLQPLWENEQDELKVLIRPLSTGTWEQLAHYTGNITEWTARVLDIPYSEPCEIAFEATSNYGYGVGLDMVEVVNTSPCQTKPDIAASGISASNITKTSADFTWIRGNGDAVLVIARKDNSIVDLPESGTPYTANSTLGSGDNLGNNTFVVYKGAGTQFTLSGLEHTSDYHLQFFEYSTSDNCYQVNPASVAISTVPNIYDITFNVTDPDTNPLVNAMVVFQGDNIYTDATGKATSTTIHSTLYTHVDVIADGFYGKSDRFVPDNSKAINLVLKPFTPLGPDNLSATTDYKNVDLTWNPVINEDFENYQSYSKSISGWEFVDEDQTDTWGISSISWPHEQDPMAFIILDVYDENILQMEYDITAWSGSKVLAAFAAQKVQSNDWIISPQFKVTDGDFFSFMARSLATTDGNIVWGYETIDIKVRLSGQTEWTTLYQDYEVPTTWTRLEFDLADYLGKRVQVAIQSKGSDTFVLLLDNLIVGPELGPLNQNPFPFAPVSSFTKKAPREKGGSFTKFENTSKVSKAHASPEFRSGNIEYAIYRDNVEIGRSYGFANNIYSDLAPNLAEYEYKVQAVYSQIGLQSEFSNIIAVETGYTINFVVKDDKANLIEGAQVSFNNETKTTDANGETSFAKVPQMNDLEYVVSALNFNDQQGTISTSSSQTIELTMNIASSSISEEANNKITLSPNPVKEMATINNLPNGFLEVEVYDLTGKQIEQKEIKGGRPAEWDFSFYQQGIYMMIIKSDTGLLHRLKIIKHRN